MQLMNIHFAVIAAIIGLWTLISDQSQTLEQSHGLFTSKYLKWFLKDGLLKPQQGDYLFMQAGILTFSQVNNLTWFFSIRVTGGISAGPGAAKTASVQSD